MSELGNNCSFQRSPCTQQQQSHTACFWEKQPSGCLRISCAFHHSKPRNINGLFLPPSNNVALQEGGQERILHPAHHQESLRNQENIFLPVHAPLIISLNSDEEDDEEDNEEIENYVSNRVLKTAAEIEEERTIKEICYKTGECYRIQYPHEHQSAETVSSPQEKEILLLEAMERDLQKSDGSRIPRTFINTKREGEISGRRISTERVPRRDRRSFENGETNHSELENKHHSKEIRKNQWISEEPRNSPNTVPGKGFNTSDRKGKPSYQPRSQRKDDETASYVPRGRAAGRKYCDSSEPRRSAYVFDCTADVTQEPKFNGSTGNGNISATLNNTKREGETSGRRVPTERIPRRNCRSFDNGGIHTSDPNIKPSYQQRCNNKDDETASSVPYVRATNRKTDFTSLEPRRSTYGFYRTVNQEPKFSGSTAVPEPHGQKCSKPKNQLDTNRRFSTQTENYETNHSELENKHHSKEIRKNQWISEEPRNSPNTVPGKGFNTSDRKGKPSYQPRSQRKDDETASYVPRGRAAGRKYCDSSEPRRSAYVFDCTADVTQEPKFNGSTGNGNISATLNNTKREGETSGRRVPTERIPRRNCRSFDNEGIHTSDPNIKPSYQQRCNNKDDETASSVPYVRATNRKTDFTSLEPRRSTYGFYRTVNQEPKFSGSTAVPEPHGQKCSKPKNQLDTNRRFSTQTENYDKYTSGFYNAPCWRKRNPRENTCSKTTIQQSQEDLGANNKGEQYVDMRKRLNECVSLQEKSTGKSKDEEAAN